MNTKKFVHSGIDQVMSQGVIHQDVKPANILMTVTGTAKITDFGLVGILAGLSLQNAKETQFENFKIPIPESLIPVLERCFHEDPQQRWQSMESLPDEIIAQMGTSDDSVSTYESQTVSDPLILNRAQAWYESNMDLTDTDLVKKYIKLLHNKVVIYSNGYDYPGALDCCRHLMTFCENLADSTREHSWYQHALELCQRASRYLENISEVDDHVRYQRIKYRLKIEQAGSLGSLGRIDEALELHTAGREIVRNLLNTYSHGELYLGDLIVCEINISKISNDLNLYHEEQKILLETVERLRPVTGSRHGNRFVEQYIMILINLSLNHIHFKSFQRAAAYLVEAEGLCEELINFKGRLNLLSLRAMINTYKAVVFSSCGDHDRARQILEKSVNLLQYLVDKGGQKQLMFVLGMSQANLGEVCTESGDYRAGIMALDSAAAILGDLADQTGNSGTKGNLGIVLVHRAETWMKMNQLETAETDMKAGMSFLKTAVDLTGNSHFKDQLNWAETALDPLIINRKESP